MPKKKTKDYAIELGEHKNIQPELIPLKCVHCGNPIPLSESDTIKCPACSGLNAIPDDYKSLRDARKKVAASEKTASELLQKLSRKPNPLMMAWYKAAQAITNVFGLIMAILLWISAASFLVVLFMIYEIFYALAPSIGINLIDVYGAGNVYALTFLVLNIVFVFPIVLNSYIKNFVDLRKTLQASLLVRHPDYKGGVASCRACGAPVEIKSGALYTRCLYCDTDNLTQLPEKWLRSLSGYANWHFKTVEEYAETEKKFRSKKRKSIYNWLKVSIILTGVFWCIGVFFRHVDNDPVSIPSWSELNTVPRKLLVDTDTSKSIPINTLVRSQRLEEEYWMALSKGETFYLRCDSLTNQVDVYIVNTTTLDGHRISQKLDWVKTGENSWIVSWKAPYKGIFGLITQTYGWVNNPFTIKWWVE